MIILSGRRDVGIEMDRPKGKMDIFILDRRWLYLWERCGGAAGLEMRRGSDGSAPAGPDFGGGAQ